MSRKDRKILGFDIAFDKSLQRIQEIADTSPKAQINHSDGLPAYRGVIYWGKHYYHFDKSETYTVEGINSDLRHYIPFLRRRSKCFLRSLKTGMTILRIFVYAYNKFCGEKMRYPKYREHYYLTQFI